MSQAQLKGDLLLLDSIKLQRTVTVVINDQLNNKNFEVIAESLRKLIHSVAEIAGIKQSSSNMRNQIADMKTKLSFQGERINYLQKEIDAQRNINNQQNDFLDKVKGDEFLKQVYQRIDEVQQKAETAMIKAKSNDVSDLMANLQKSQKFVLSDLFNQFKQSQNEKETQIMGRLDFKVDTSEFKNFKHEIGDDLILTKQRISVNQERTHRLQESMVHVEKDVRLTKKELTENNGLLKEIEVVGQDSKYSVLKEEMGKQISDLTSKVRRRATFADISRVQSQIVERLDSFMAQLQQSIAYKDQLRNGFQYLQNQFKQIYPAEKDPENQKMDALFATSKVWQCAACASTLGKYEGKLHKYKPWSVFPCREHTPQKLGGFGYLGHIQKYIKKSNEEIDQSAIKSVTVSKKKEDPNSTRVTDKPMNFREYYERQESGEKKEQDQRAERSSLRVTNGSFRLKPKSLRQP